jgi:prevent-host-death family protein
METEMSSETLRNKLADALGEVQFAKNRIVISRHGKPVAALVPLDDLETLRKPKAK